jgi:hypothetical protein
MIDQELDDMAERQDAWRKELGALIRAAEAVGTDIIPLLAEALAHDIEVMAATNRDRAATYVMIVAQGLLSAINPIEPPPNVTRH